MANEKNTKAYIELLRNERKKILNVLRETFFTQLDNTIVHKQVIPSASYSPWESDKDFIKVYKHAKSNTLVDIYRCYELWSLALGTQNLEGDILEVGVWRGGTAAILGEANKKSKNSVLYLADTFKGVVKAGKNDTLYKGGEHADATENTVKKLLQLCGVSNYQLLKGIFPDSFGNKLKIKKLKVCHIDVDTYGSAKSVFEYAWPKMVSKGIVVFDDYAAWGCEGVTKYVNSLKLNDGVFIHNLNGHAVMIKV
jgi:O-methyltransferase